MARHGGSDGAELPGLPVAGRRWLQAPSVPGNADEQVTVVRAGIAPARIGWLVGEVQRLAADPDLGAGRRIAQTLTADYGGGILRIALAGADVQRLAAALQRVRAALESERGYLFLERAPAALTERIGPWGELGGEAALMRVLRRQMDPHEILAPGRFL
jgi:glycolate oxidase FAD binding subunit